MDFDMMDVYDMMEPDYDRDDDTRDGGPECACGDEMVISANSGDWACPDCDLEATDCECDDVSERDDGRGYHGMYDDLDDDYRIDGVGFADPGGNSSLRAATRNNPRNLPCPTCGRPNMLTPIDVAHHYQCDRCADALEFGGY